LRLLRALIATWHHKIRHSGRHDEATLHRLIETLARELPQYRLPAATHCHTRHYMPQRNPGHTSLVFDAFAAVHRDEALYITWPTLSLMQDETALLDDLLGVMGYLGRAESWVEASRALSQEDPNCVPADSAFEPEAGESRGEVVTLLAPLASTEYQGIRTRFLAERGADDDFESTLPDTLLAALSVETSALRKVGWSQHPATRRVHYLRPGDAFRPKRVAQKYVQAAFTTARYLLLPHRREGQSGPPQPRIEESVRIGELLRQAVMSKAGQRLGKEAIPPALSGHDLPEGNRHQHAFYLPFDANGDGRIDRLVIHVPSGLGDAERGVLENIKRIWSRRGEEWRVTLEGIGSRKVAGALADNVTCWQSVTPYLHPWHVKHSLTIEDQLRRECRQRGLPELVTVERVASVLVGKELRRRSPIHFRRFRAKRGLNQPDSRGSFWRLTFAGPVEGPLALGFGCHFGLGLFVPDEARSANETMLSTSSPRSSDGTSDQHCVDQGAARKTRRRSRAE
jgi:CRISPR-associated protein Csb2